MTGLPEEDLVQLWRQMGDRKDWSNFMRAVMGQCGRTEKLDPLMVDYLVREAYDLSKTNYKFPDTPARLLQVLADRLGRL